MVPTLPIVITLALLATPGAAQDIPSPYDGAIAEHGQRQLEDTLSRRRLEQAQQSRKAAPGSIDSRRRSSCAALPGFVRQHGRDDPRVQKLTALCRRGGYIR